MGGLATAPAVYVYHAGDGRAVLIELRQSLRLQASTRYRWLFALRGGGGRFAIGRRSVPLNAGDTIAVPPHIIHGYKHPPGSPPLIALLLDILPAPLDKPRSALTTGPGQVSVANAPSLRGDVEALADVLLSSQTDKPAVTAIVTQRFRQLANTLLDRTDTVTAVGGGAGTGGDRRIEHAIRLLQAQLDEPLAINVLAPKVGLSRAQFFLLFQRHTGLTPATYWNMLRMELALTMLATHTQPVSSLATRLGFSALANFIRYFCSFQGTTPERYRRAINSAHQA